MSPEQQKQKFEDEGYLIVEAVMSEAELASCEAEIHRLHEVTVQLEATQDPALKHFQREPYAKDKQENGLPVLRKIEQTRDFSQVFRKLAAHPKLTSVVQNLIGEDLLLFRSTLMLKPAFHGSAHAFHQDSAYWPMDPPSLVTVSMALTESTSENGCIQVIPGSHKWGMQEWGSIAQNTDTAQANRDDIDTSGAIEAPLKAGSVVLFHSLMVHGSGPNKSARARHTALYAYFPPTVRLVSRGSQSTSRSFPVISGLGGVETLEMASVVLV
jgi:ectoine hydroxylase-related dioxygenase (phytanoyl-CoA dioxygenase family)